MWPVIFYNKENWIFLAVMLFFILWNYQPVYFYGKNILVLCNYGRGAHLRRTLLNIILGYVYTVLAIISQYKINTVNILWLQNICFVLKSRNFETETSWLVSVGLFSHCLVFNWAGSLITDNERQNIIKTEIIWYILELHTHFLY